jgi:N-acetylglucosaminyldiphosphoundecaprenol N-acetyl-beta-D-mannosaminyltransferase
VTSSVDADQKIPRANVLGVGVSSVNLSQAVAAIDEALQKKCKGYICFAGVHPVMEAQADVELKRIYNRSFLTTPDGMPMVWLNRWQGARHVSRVYGPDLMLAVFQLSEQRGYRHFFYGGSDGVAEAMRVEMLKRFPKLQVVGVHEPPFRALTAEEEEHFVTQVRAVRPDILWVGLGSPKQDRFMAEMLPKLDVTLMAGVGAAFNFFTGRVPQAPRWMQRSGLEWFYRCIHEPRVRGRYFSTVPRFLIASLAQSFRLKRYETPAGEPGQDFSSDDFRRP